MDRIVEISLLKSWAQYYKDPRRYLAKLIEEYGDIFKIHFTLFGIPLLKANLFVNPICIRHILFDKSENYSKTPFAYRVANNLIGKKSVLMTNDYSIWKRERTILNPVFKEEYIRDYADIMVETTAKSLEKWEGYSATQQPISIESELLSITFTNLSKTLFLGAKLDHNIIKPLLSDVSKLISSGSRYFGLISTPYTYYKSLKLKRKLKILGDLIVETSLSENGNEKNIIKILSNNYLQNNLPEAQAKEALRAEAQTFLSAAHETLTATLTWTLVYLSLHPIHAEKIKEEIKNTIGTNRPTYSDIPKLSYTQAVLKEILRLQPPLSILLKSANEKDLIGSHVIKKGDVIFISPYHIHRIPQYWPNPEGFDPSRFLKPMEDSYKFLYIPFGLGPRSCIGQHFAVLESVIILAMIFQNYTPWLTSSSSLDLKKDSTLFTLNSELTMTLQKN